jgi:hypothetical protein
VQFAFLLFVYINIVIEGSIIRGDVMSFPSLTPPHACVCHKPGYEFPTLKVVVFFGTMV